jgi:hypothetical protein
MSLSDSASAACRRDDLIAGCSGGRGKAQSASPFQRRFPEKR